MIVSNQDREHCAGALDASTPDTIFSTAVLFLLFRARFRGSGVPVLIPAVPSAGLLSGSGGKAESGSVLKEISFIPRALAQQ